MVEEPLQIVAEPAVATTVGKGLTVIICVPVLVQPAVLAPVTVYVVVVVAVQVTDTPVVALKPVAGVHVYVLAPEAPIVVDDPIQYADEPGVTVTVGVAFTVTDLVPVLVQPAAEVPVTVNMVDVVPVSVTGDPVDELKPVVGDHE